MGGAAATQDFARLFLLPGVAHCGGGQGPDSIDALSAIIGWVTEDQAPDSLFSQDIDSGGNVTAARPVYPYPYIAVNTTGGYTARQELTRPLTHVRPAPRRCRRR